MSSARQEGAELDLGAGGQVTSPRSPRESMTENFGLPHRWLVLVTCAA